MSNNMDNEILAKAEEKLTSRFLGLFMNYLNEEQEAIAASAELQNTIKAKLVQKLLHLAQNDTIAFQTCVDALATAPNNRYCSEFTKSLIKDVVTADMVSTAVEKITAKSDFGEFVNLLGISIEYPDFINFITPEMVSSIVDVAEKNPDRFHGSWREDYDLLLEDFKDHPALLQAALPKTQDIIRYEQDGVGITLSFNKESGAMEILYSDNVYNMVTVTVAELNQEIAKADEHGDYTEDEQKFVDECKGLLSVTWKALTLVAKGEAAENLTVITRDPERLQRNVAAQIDQWAVKPS